LSRNLAVKVLVNSVLIQPVCQILDPEVDGDGTKRVEANILKLVTEYQNTKKREPELVKDINQVRRLLGQQTSSPEFSMALRLGNDGYDIEVLTDAKSAVKTIMNSVVDLVVSEINLPGTDGLRFCQALRENSSTAHIPFFFLAREKFFT